MRIHFISGLPRSGSTLLEGILRQNPRFHAAVASPLPDMFSALVRSMSGFNEESIFISDEQRRRILRSVIEAYYADRAGQVIFDTGRSWTARLPALAELFPEARIIACVRSPAWILDSVERHIQRNPFGAQRMFSFDVRGNVYTRVETLMAKDGLVRRALSNLRQAWFGEFANRLIAVPYDRLVSNPADTISRLYEAIGEAPYAHDFNQVEYNEPQYDQHLGLPGFHKVSGPVRAAVRESILPPEIFKQYNDSFWNVPDQNPRRVVVL